MKTTPGTKATRITIDADFSATELEALIRQLATLRAGMQPPVPMDSGEAAGGNISGMIETATGMGAHLAGQGSNGDPVTLRLRSVGLGWISWSLSSQHIYGLQGFLNSHFPTGLDEAPFGTQKPAH